MILLASCFCVALSICWLTSAYVACTVADLEIKKGGFSHRRALRAGNFGVATPTFGHVNAFIQNIAGRPNRGVRHKRNLVHCPTVLF